MIPILGTMKPSQIAIIVHDIEETKKRYAEFWGVDVPPTIGAGEYAVTQTEYRGKPAPDATCLMAFFKLGDGLELEIIQPNEAPSIWRDFLEEHGEGLHHIAFDVKDMKKSIDACKAFGLEMTQWGRYGDNSGEYAYFDAMQSLKCYVELLIDY